MTRFKTLLLGCLFSAPFTAVGADFHHTKWTSENGLGAVFDIQQDSQGYLWLTTSKGVLRFDGVRFQPVEEVTHGAVRNGDIDSVFFPASGGLWLTTEGAGLLLWKDGRLTPFADRRCTPTRKQGRLVEDRDGWLWVQAAAGLFHLRGSVCEQVGAGQGYPGGFAAGIFMDRSGTLWVKTRKGPLLFLPHGQSQFQARESEGEPTTSYAFLHQAPDGAIWLSDDQGLRPITSQPTHKTQAHFGDFTFAPDGSLWAVNDKGVEGFEHPGHGLTAPSQTFTPTQGLSSDAVWKVMIDREGVVWVGTNSGLDRLRHTVLSTVALPHAPEHEFSIAAGDQGAVWTGNSSMPLTRVAADSTTVTFPGTRQTLCLRRDHNGTIWSAGAGDFHLWRSSGAGFSPLHYPGEDLDSVVSVATDRNNETWITTRSGRAYHFANGEWSNENKALGKKPGVIGAMVDDRSGNIWFGFSNKVVQWDGSGYHRFSFPGGTRGVSESTMSVRGDHVWLGGPGGVQLFTHGHFYLMRWKDPDLPGRVSGVVETETGDLWVNGFSGVTHVFAAELTTWVRDTSSAVSAEHFDEMDGLPGLSGEKLPEPSVVEAPDGRLWFATTKGLAWLDPASLEKNRNRLPPPVIISAAISKGRTYDGSRGVTLPAHTENLEIDYTALSLGIPERVLFRYKLDGAGNEWQNVGTRRQAYYTKLRPGRYTFHVTACNSEGVWNDRGATLDLQVLPAWFQTSWFLVLCLAGGGIALSLLYRLRVRQIAAAMNARFDERLAERNRIAREFHDTLLQTIQGSKMMADHALECDTDPVLMRNTMERMSGWLGQAMEEARSALDSLRNSTIQRNDLAKALQCAAEECVAQRPIEFNLTLEGTGREMHPIVRDEVYRIGYEAIRNACVHSGASSVTVELSYAEGLILRVRDNGKGIDPDVAEKGKERHFGVIGMYERASRIGGKLSISSAPGTGTVVELVVPRKSVFQPRTPMRKGVSI